MPILRPSSSDFTSFVKAAAQYVPAGGGGKVSKSGGVPVALPGLGAIIRTSLVGALASPSTSALIMDGPTSSPAAAAVIRVLLGIVTTIAGSGSPAFADGTSAGASFSGLFGVAVIPSSGVIVVADTNNNRIRLVTPSGVVTTLAGNATASFVDATGTNARFNTPYGVAVIPSTGDIVVADTSNNRIRIVTPAGVVTTLAGSTSGSADGTGAAATFSSPTGVAVIPSTGDIVVADFGNHRIRLVTYPGGVVTTLAGSTSGSADGTGAAASFSSPIGVAVIPSTGNIAVADRGNHLIRIVTPLGVVTTLAGSTSGFLDATGTNARFSTPQGVAATSSGDIIVADSSNQRIRLITSAGVVTTLAGSTSGFADGTGAAASFSGPTGVAVTPTGDVVVGDQANNRIRLIV